MEEMWKSMTLEVSALLGLSLWVDQVLALVEWPRLCLEWCYKAGKVNRLKGERKTGREPGVFL